MEESKKKKRVEKDVCDVIVKDLSPFRCNASHGLVGEYSCSNNGKNGKAKVKIHVYEKFLYCVLIIPVKIFHFISIFRHFWVRISVVRKKKVRNQAR